MTTFEIPTLTTARLVLRPLELADADALQQIFPRWEIMRFLGLRDLLALSAGRSADIHPRDGVAGDATGFGMALDDPTKDVSGAADRRDQSAG
jgi:hypothetical protein